MVTTYCLFNLGELAFLGFVLLFLKENKNSTDLVGYIESSKG